MSVFLCLVVFLEDVPVNLFRFCSCVVLLDVRGLERCVFNHTNTGAVLKATWETGLSEYEPFRALLYHVKQKLKIKLN